MIRMKILTMMSLMMTMMKTAQNKSSPGFSGVSFCITNLDKLSANIYIYAYDKFDEQHFRFPYFSSLFGGADAPYIFMAGRL